MAINVNLDMMLVRRKMSLTELSSEVGVTIANLSVLKTGRARAVRFSTLKLSAGPWTVSRGIYLNISLITVSLLSMFFCM